MATQAIDRLVNKVVGKVRVSKPQHYRDASYECAAWWQERVSETGVFDVYLRRDPYNKDHIFLSAELPATVVKENFQNYFGGVSCGQPFDETANAGKPSQDVTICKSVIDVVKRNQAFFDDENGNKWAITPSCYHLITPHYRELVKRETDYLIKLTNGGSDLYKGERQTMEGIRYAADRITKSADTLREILWAAEHHDEAVFLKNNPFMNDFAVV